MRAAQKHTTEARSGWLRLAIYGLSVTGSVWMCWAAWRGPPPDEGLAAPPPALSRTASATDIKQAEAMATALTDAVQRAKVRAGRPLAISELEGRDAQGNPWLDQPIPDSPLTPGVSTVAQSCGAEQALDADWVYCPDSGTIRAGLPKG